MLMIEKRKLFENKIFKGKECWFWIAAVRNGYGIFRSGNGTNQLMYAHRYSYELYKEPIPEGLHIDHLCGEKLCVNPDHLVAVNQADHNRRHLYRFNTYAQSKSTTSESTKR